MPVLLFLGPPLKNSLKYIQIKFSFLKLHRTDISSGDPSLWEWNWGAQLCYKPQHLHWPQRQITLGVIPGLGHETQKNQEMLGPYRPCPCSVACLVTSETWKEFSIQDVWPSWEETGMMSRFCAWSVHDKTLAKIRLLRCKKEDDCQLINNQNREPLPFYAAVHETTVKQKLPFLRFVKSPAWVATGLPLPTPLHWEVAARAR